MNIDTEKNEEILKTGRYGVVFPKDKTNENAAMELAELIENSRAVASFIDNEDKEKVNYGVIVDLIYLDSKTIESEENDEV